MNANPPVNDETERSLRRRSLTGRLLRIPLFYKILIANAAIVLIGSVMATVAARTAAQTANQFPLSWLFVLATIGVGATILVNALILRVALSPLKLLEETAARIQSGDIDARVAFSPLRDPELERLTRTFNGMLDNLEGYRQRLSGIAARALNAEEEERKRIARELHDDTAQSLASLLIRLRLLRAVEDRDSRDQALEEMRIEVGDALERIRRFARGLRPPALDELGLVPALESHVRSLSESVGIPIRVEADEMDGSLSRQAELALYRIAQEATSNAVRHAGPERVLISLRRRRNTVELEVSDDGSGFDVEEVTSTEHGGLGLFGMRERAGYVGGTVYIVSSPGSGTRVVARIPAEGGGMTAN